MGVLGHWNCGRCLCRAYRNERSQEVNEEHYKFPSLTATENELLEQVTCGPCMHQCRSMKILITLVTATWFTSLAGTIGLLFDIAHSK
jgi:hypothetical protein